jgi:hypothetical protein
MKKVIVLLTVAMFASVANAATWDIRVNGGAWDGGSVGPSDIITLVFNEPVSGFGGFGDFTANVSLGEYQADTLGFHPGPWVLAPFGSVTPQGGGFDVYAAASGFPAPTGDIMWLDFHVPEVEESTEIVISHVLGSWNNVFPPGAVADLVLHVTPEPTTIALLGFGALALLRRRK